MSLVLRVCYAGVVMLFATLSGNAAAEQLRLDGFNIVVTPVHRFGSAGAGRAIAQAKRVGASTLAVIPFLWQATPTSGTIQRGDDMPDDEFRSAIRQVHAEGLRVVIKPHVWVPQSWAGAIAPAEEGDWRTWFAGYEHAIANIARIAAEERADAFILGTELRLTIARPEWRKVIATVRAVYPGPMLYVAHNIEGAERVPFWPELDAIGISLYPPLGADDDRNGRMIVIESVAARIDAIARLYGKPVIVGEVGLRSARGAAATPWQSPEERVAGPDPQLQADVLADWMRVLDRPSVRGVMIWRWLTDPDAGGSGDTDFTVQGKPAEAVLQCAWAQACAEAIVPFAQNR
jgi:hypothetical protein